MKLYHIAHIVILIIMSSSQCITENFYSILFVNNSNSSIELYFVKPGGERFYPDTTLVEQRPIFITVPSGEDKAADLKVEYKLFFDVLPSDTLSIFAISSDTLNAYPWEVIRNEYKILKRYDLSYQDLEQSNWTVTYP